MARQFEQALIVDDSRTARAVLKHMLSKEAFKVEVAESAEKALSYLDAHLTDVIFMDHMMPGMDGFTAVKSIKNNSRLAHIPIVMYTSKEGDVYKGQAHALGAAAILSKPATQEQLQATLSILADQAAASTPEDDDKGKDKVDEPGEAPFTNPKLVEVELVEPIVNVEHASDLLVQPRPGAKAATGSATDKAATDTGTTVVTIEAASSKTADFVHKPGSAKQTSSAAILSTERTAARTTASASSSSFWIWLAVIVSVLLAVVGVRNVIMAGELEQANRSKQVLLEALVNSSNVAGQYHSGEVPFAGARIEALNELLIGANAAGFTGTVLARAHAGLFCQRQTTSGELFVASDGMSISRCDVIGQNAQAALRRTGRQSSAFKAFVANNAILASDGINLRIEAVGSEEPQTNYPTVDLVKTAGDWNKVARENNRVQFTLIPKN